MTSDLLGPSIAGLAKGQHGVVERLQLIALGLTAAAIDHWVRRGRLHPVHRGVYAVGHSRLTQGGRWMAAALRGGERAAVRRRSAGALWELRRFSGAVEIAAPRRIRERGINASHTSFPPDEATVRDGIPVTTVARTLLDLATILPAQQLEQAANEAEVRRYSDATSLDELVERYPRRPGTVAIRALLDRGRVGETVTRSEFEAAFLAFLDAAVLSRPRTNAHVEVANATYECDCVWPLQRLIVELDGHAFHATRRAFERDRARDRALTAAGWRVIRITWTQLHDEPERLARDLRAALGVSAQG